MTIQHAADAIELPQGHTGSTLFHALLREAVERFPAALSAARLPASAGTFKREYGTALARFEAARAAAPERVEIARFLHARTQQALRFGKGADALPLDDYMAQPVATPLLQRTHLRGVPGLPAEVPFEGRVYRGRALSELANRLYESHQLSDAARAGLCWIVDRALGDGGVLDLRGQRFVLLGAGAELSPAPLLLQAGAEVLWVDLADPERMLARAGVLSGSVVHAPGARNLLEHPREIAAAVRAFAQAGPVHMGLFAYAPGASKEWRLAAAMTAIVNSLPRELLASVALLISPTTPRALSSETVQAAEQRLLSTPLWQRLGARFGLLSRPGSLRAHDVSVSLSTVSLQGLSYQAAQYISKVAAAETYAVFGNGRASAPLTVSANVAGVTRTRSLAHPLFQAAFQGAEKFGVRIFDVETTRALNGLLMLHDLLNPHAASSRTKTFADDRAKATALMSQQIHGGLYSLPYELEGVIRAAALLGLAAQPGLMLGKSAPSRAPVAFAPAE